MIRQAIANTEIKVNNEVEINYRSTSLTVGPLHPAVS